jgi:hypothetical protein
MGQVHCATTVTANVALIMGALGRMRSKSAFLLSNHHLLGLPNGLQVLQAPGTAHYRAPYAAQQGHHVSVDALSFRAYQRSK